MSMNCTINRYGSMCIKGVRLRDRQNRWVSQAKDEDESCDRERRRDDTTEPAGADIAALGR